MRKSLHVALLLAALPLLFGLNAAGAQEPEKLKPCTNTSGATVLTLAGNTGTIAPPQMPLWMASATKVFILDLAGNLVTKDRAAVGVTLSWENPVNDYDMNVLDAAGEEVSHSENISVLDGPGETGGGSFAHCERFTVEVLNWTAVRELEPNLGLALTAATE